MHSYSYALKDQPVHIHCRASHLYLCLDRRMEPILSCLIAGSVFFPCLFLFIRRFCTWLLKVINQRDDTAISSTISMRSVSIVQAILASVAGFTILYATCKDVIYDRSSVVESYASFGAPYMVYDIVAMFLVHREEKQLTDAPTVIAVQSFLAKQHIIVLHHLVVAFVLYPLVMLSRNGKGDFFVGCFFLTELSTPALNLRTILIKLGLGDTVFFRMNHALVIIMFFTCRILIFPFMYWVYSYTKMLPFLDTLSTMRAVCHIGCAALLAVQVMWFGMFVKAGLRYRHSRDAKGQVEARNGYHPPLVSMGTGKEK